jgi:hypothetical protein
MKRQRMKRGLLTFVIVGVAVLLGAMLGRAQSVFPMRFDDPQGLTVSPSGIVTDFLVLEPRSSPPFSCAPSVYGAIYMQTDETVGAVWAYSQIVCQCLPKDDGSGDFWKGVGTTTLDCAGFLAP